LRHGVQYACNWGNNCCRNSGCRNRNLYPSYQMSQSLGRIWLVTEYMDLDSYSGWLWISQLCSIRPNPIPIRRESPRFPYPRWMEGWVDLGYPAMERPGVEMSWVEYSSAMITAWDKLHGFSEIVCRAIFALTLVAKSQPRRKADVTNPLGHNVITSTVAHRLSSVTSVSVKRGLRVFTLKI